MVDPVLLQNRAFFDNARVYVTLPDGTREVFRFVPKGRSLLFETIFSPRFTPQQGSTSTLTVNRRSATT